MVTSGESLGVAVVLALSALSMGGLGYLIRYRKRYHLISGFDPERVSDPDGLAEVVGGGALLLAVLTAGTAVVELLQETNGTLWLGYTAMVVGVSGWLLWRTREFRA